MSTCETPANGPPSEGVLQSEGLLPSKGAAAVATASDEEEVILLVPKEIVEFSLGFVVDAGGSVTKLIYRSKKDYENGKPKEGASTHGKLRMRYFRLGANGDVLKFIKENCDILEKSKYDPKKEGPVWNQTGVYTQFFKTAMEESFQIKVTLTSESLAISKAIEVMRAMELKCLPPSVKAAAFCLKAVRGFLGLLQSWKDIGDNSFEVLTKKDTRSQQDHTMKMMTISAESFADELGKQEVEYPCILNPCGSASGCMILDDDGTSSVCFLNTVAGKSFLGLGEALTGAKNFDELITMASGGDTEKVDILAGDLKNKNHDEKDWYSEMPNENVVFSLGKLTVGDQQEVPYSKDDIAAGVLHLICMTQARFAILNARLNKIKSVVFCGSFFNPAIARETLERYFLVDAMLAMLAGEEQIKIHVLPHPGYICGLGVWLQNLEIEKQLRT